ncbi:MAG TPA: phage portal protein, partial [Kofleriaceae bacterium]
MRTLLGALTNRAVATPVPYVGSRFGATRSLFAGRSGRTEQLQAKGLSGTLFGVVDTLVEKTAAVGWKLYVDAPEVDDREVVPKHLALDLWRKPNPFMNNRLFVEIMQQYFELTGEAPMVVVKLAGVPIELWPIRPDRLEPIPHPIKFLSGFVYHGPDGEDVPLGTDEVVRMIRPDPDNIYRGLGPVQALARTLDAARYSEEWNRAFFVNSAEPGGLIEFEDRLSDTEFAEFRDRWAESHQGVSAAHRVAILENGMKWVDRKYTMKDMQFAELATLGDAKILTAYRMSKFGVGQVDDVNRATADASRAQIAQDLVVPRLDKWADLLNGELLPMFGASTRGLVFGYDDPVPPDAEQRRADELNGAQVASLLVPLGFDAASVVEAYGLPEALKFSGAPEPTPAGAPNADPAEGGDTTSDSPGPTDRADWIWLRNRLVNETPAVPATIDDVQAEWERERDQLISTYATAYNAQLDELQQQIVTAVQQRTPAQLATLAVTTTATAAAILAAMQTLAAVAAATMVREAALQGVTCVA